MPHYYCHDHPEALVLESTVVDARPGAVVLAETPFYPGGGGQPADQGELRADGGVHRITGFSTESGRLWHVVEGDAVLDGAIEAAVDPAFRLTMRQLHTGTHILNAIVFQEFDGALVNGVQMYGDGTARMDFDIANADNDRLRALAGPINEAIAADLAVTTEQVPYDEAQEEAGLIRSLQVAPPPTPDGRIRVVRIAGLDRQACGGTHLASTGNSPPLRILKIDNKGRRNRRIRIGLEGHPGVPARGVRA